MSTYELFYGNAGWVFDMSSPVVQACWMVHVHFEVYHSLLHRPNMRMDWAHTPIPTCDQSSNDVTWGHQIVALCGRILQWTEKEVRLPSEWHELEALVNDWESRRPASFEPLYQRGEGLEQWGSPTELWYSSLCHGTLCLFCGRWSK